MSIFRWCVINLWQPVMVVRCLVLHRRYRKRTGERRIRQVSIAYDVVCERCGIEDVEIECF